MDETESNLRREIRDLRAEVRYLRNQVRTGFTVVLIGVAFVFPELAGLVVVIGVLIFFAFMVSPVRNLIFKSLLHRPDSGKHNG